MNALPWLKTLREGEDERPALAYTLREGGDGCSAPGAQPVPRTGFRLLVDWNFYATSHNTTKGSGGGPIGAVPGSSSLAVEGLSGVGTAALTCDRARRRTMAGRPAAHLIVLLDGQCHEGAEAGDAASVLQQSSHAWMSGFRAQLETSQAPRASGPRVTRGGIACDEAKHTLGCW